MNTEVATYLLQEGLNTFGIIDDPVHDPDAEKCYIIGIIVNNTIAYVPVFAGDVITTDDPWHNKTIEKNMEKLIQNPYNYILCDDVIVKDGPGLPVPTLSDFMPPKLFGVEVDKLVNKTPTAVNYLFDSYHNSFNIDFIIASAADTAGLLSNGEVFFENPVGRFPIEVNIKPPYRKEVQKFLDGVRNKGRVPNSYWGGVDDYDTTCCNDHRKLVPFEYKHSYPFTVYYFRSFKSAL